MANATTPWSRRRGDSFRVGEGVQESDEHGLRRKSCDLDGGRGGDSDDALGALEQRVRVDELGAGLRVVLVREPGRGARSALDADRKAVGPELGNGFGDERDATLAGSRLPRNRDSHAGETLRPVRRARRKRERRSDGCDRSLRLCSAAGAA